MVVSRVLPLAALGAWNGSHSACLVVRVVGAAYAVPRALDTASPFPPASRMARPHPAEAAVGGGGGRVPTADLRRAAARAACSPLERSPPRPPPSPPLRGWLGAQPLAVGWAVCVGVMVGLRAGGALALCGRCRRASGMR